MTQLLPTSTEQAPSTAGHIRRFVADAFAGLGLFTLAMVTTSGPGALALESTTDMLQQPTVARPWLLLALVFSMLFALNASFFRHLARAYARNGRK